MTSRLCKKTQRFYWQLKEFAIERLSIAVRKLKRYTFRYEKFSKNPFGLKALPYPVKWDKLQPYEKLFVEIGTGHGELISHLSSSFPNRLFIGFEIISKFAKMSSKRVENRQNALVFKAEAYGEIPLLFSNNSIDCINILFPDPWHKKRHHKRRPINANFFNNVKSRLKLGGTIFVATDWEEYFEYICDEASKVSDLYAIEKGIYTPEKFGFPVTHYYKKWQGTGRKFQFIELSSLNK